MRTMITCDRHDHVIDVYDGEPADGTYVGNVRREHKGWVAYRTPWKGIENGGHQRDAAGRLIHFDSAEDAATHLVPDAAPAPATEGTARGPKGQTEPPKPRAGSRYDYRGYQWSRLPSEARRNAVRARAGALCVAGTHTPAKAWDAALREDFATYTPVPDESTYALCVPAMGGDVHLTNDTPEGDYPPVPHCRTMNSNSRGTAYRFVDHGDVTCEKCLTYRARRQERRDRITKG
jgi:hypothetical protein